MTVAAPSEKKSHRNNNPNFAANLTARGRPKGVPNKATASIKALAMQYTPEAIAELGRLATQAENEATRVAAIKELFDRAYGKPKQEIEHTGTIGIAEMILERRARVAAMETAH